MINEKKNGMINRDIKIFNFMPRKHPCRLPHGYSFKNKIFEISWVFVVIGLTERDEKYYIYIIYTILL